MGFDDAPADLAARSLQLVGFFFLGVNFDAMLNAMHSVCRHPRAPPPGCRRRRRDVGVSLTRNPSNQNAAPQGARANDQD
jgi:hypothetical protein